MNVKTCSKCGLEQPESEYYLDRGRPRAVCKTCFRAARKLYGQTHKEETAVAGRRYRQSEDGAAKRKAWHAARAKTPAHKEYMGQWAKTPKGQAARRGRVNRYAQTPKGRAANMRRRARRRSVLAGVVADLTADQWSEIVAEHGSCCAYCGAKFTASLPITVDHVIPLSKGGQHTAGNVVPSCKPCNSRKKDRLP